MQQRAQQTGHTPAPDDVPAPAATRDMRALMAQVEGRG